MKLFVLRSLRERPAYDVSRGFVIRAAEEGAARIMASRCAGDEGEATWLAPTLSTCEALADEGEAEIVLHDFNAG